MARAALLPVLVSRRVSPSSSEREVNRGSPPQVEPKKSRSRSPWGFRNVRWIGTVLWAGTLILYQSVSRTLTIRLRTVPLGPPLALVQEPFCSELSSDPAFSRVLTFG